MEANVEKLESKVEKLSDDMNRLWSEHKMNGVKSSQFEASIHSISKELHEMKEKEVGKAVDRQRQFDMLTNIGITVESLSKSFTNHVQEEMVAYSKIKKSIYIMGVALVAIIIDIQYNTHIVGSIWTWLMKSVIGL